MTHCKNCRHEIFLQETKGFKTWKHIHVDRRNIYVSFICDCGCTHPELREEDKNVVSQM